MTAAEASELTAFLSVHLERQDIADSITSALERHLAGKRLALTVQAEREEIARTREHYWRLTQASGCADCLSNCGEYPCENHSINKDYL